MKKAKILLLIDHLGVGGAQEIVYDLCRLLGDKFDFSVAYFFQQDNYKDKIEKLGVKTYSLGTTDKYSLATVWNPVPFFRLFKLVKQEEFDIVHIHLYAVTIWMIFIKMFFPRIKVVNSIHAPRRGLPMRLYWIYRLAKRFTDIFVAEYDSTIKDLRAYGVKKESIRHINFGSNIVDNFSAPQEFNDLHQELGIKPGAPVLLSVARLSQERQIDKFISLMPDIASQLPEAKLVIVGDGPLEGKLKQLTQASPARDNIVFTGYRKDLPDLLNLCNIYITVYENANPMSVAAIQAWIYKKTVGGFNIGGQKMADIRTKYPFIISSGDLKELAYELIKVLSDPSMQNQFGEAGEKFVKSTYSLKFMMAKYDVLYNELLNTYSKK